MLCHACHGALPWLPVDGCVRCGLPRPCAGRRCPAHAAPFAAAWAPLSYEGPARTLALAGKDRAARRVAPWFAAAMTARVPAAVTDGVTAVVAVPSDPGRLRRRGEDHAALLAAGVASSLGVPRLELLRRRRSSQAQHHRSRAERTGLVAPELVGTPPDGVLVVDDVHTTGATVRAAASALRAGGARRVTVLTALRTLR
jgi:predicted amidophosphoribosyltransferase